MGIKKIENHQDSFEKKNGDEQTAALDNIKVDAQDHTDKLVSAERKNAQNALDNVKEELSNRLNLLGEEHTAFVENKFTPKVAHLNHRIDTRKHNADKILEAGASAVPGTFFAELKNNAKKRGSGRCDGKGGDRTCTDHYEKTFGQCNCGSQWIDHEKAMYYHPRREMKPLEESKETEPEDAGGDNADGDEHSDGGNDGGSQSSGYSQGYNNFRDNHTIASGDTRASADDREHHTSTKMGEFNNPKHKRRLATAELTPSEKALRRRRLSNHPKSHVVVLERLMEEINRLN